MWLQVPSYNEGYAILATIPHVLTSIFFLRVWRALTIGDYDPKQPGAPKANLTHKKSTTQAAFTFVSAEPSLIATPASAALAPTGRPGDYPAGAVVQKQNH